MRCPALGMTSDGRTLAYGRSLGEVKIGAMSVARPWDAVDFAFLAGVDETADHP